MAIKDAKPLNVQAEQHRQNIKQSSSSEFSEAFHKTADKYTHIPDDQEVMNILASLKQDHSMAGTDINLDQQLPDVVQTKKVDQTTSPKFSEEISKTVDKYSRIPNDQEAMNILASLKQDHARSSSTVDSSLQIPNPVRTKMENSFNTDFSNVRVNENGDAEKLGALAYTQGNTINFAKGQYNPHSQAGQELLGHELAHVVQQRQGRVRAQAKQMKGVMVNNQPALEQEADVMGKKAAQGQQVINNQVQENNAHLQNAVMQMKPLAHADINDAMTYDKTIIKTDDNPIEKEERFDPADPTKKSSENIVRAGELEAIICPTNHKGVSNVSVKPLGWWWIGVATPPKTITSSKKPGQTKVNKHDGWVRFHLLNAELGGKGNELTHLVTTTHKANASSEWQKQFEEKAKNEVINNHKWIRYYVNIEKWYDPPSPPVQIGDVYYKFFPKVIEAQYEVWKPSGPGSKSGSWEPPVKVELTDQQHLNPPPREIGDQTLYFNNPSKAMVKAYNFDDAVKTLLLTDAKDSLLKLDATADHQKLYDTLYNAVEFNRNNPSVNSSNANPRIKDDIVFNDIWKKKLEPLLANTSGQMARITSGSAALTLPSSVKLKLNQARDFKGDFVNLDDNLIKQTFKIPDDVINAIKEILSKKHPLTVHKLYEKLTEEVKRKYPKNWPDRVQNLLDKDWNKWIKSLTDESIIISNKIIKKPYISFSNMTPVTTYTKQKVKIKEEIDSVKKSLFDVIQKSFKLTNKDEAKKIVETFVKTKEDNWFNLNETRLSLVQELTVKDDLLTPMGYPETDSNPLEGISDKLKSDMYNILKEIFELFKKPNPVSASSSSTSSNSDSSPTSATAKRPRSDAVSDKRPLKRHDSSSGTHSEKSNKDKEFELWKSIINNSSSFGKAKHELGNDKEKILNYKNKFLQDPNGKGIVIHLLTKYKKQNVAIFNDLINSLEYWKLPHIQACIDYAKSL